MLSYDQNAAPLTTRLKFQLAAKVAIDPITFIGVGIAAGAEQAGDNPRLPPEPDIAVGREAVFQLWTEAGFGSERFGRLHCVITRANLQPAVAAYVLGPGDATWRALALDVLRVEEGVITEIVVFAPDVFPAFGLPLTMEGPSPRKSF